MMSCDCLHDDDTRISEWLDNEILFAFVRTNRTSVTSFLSYANDLCRRACIYVRFAHDYYSIANATGSTVTGAIMLDLSGAQLLKRVPSLLSRRDIRRTDSREIRVHRISGYLQSPVRRSLDRSLVTANVFNVTRSNISYLEQQFYTASFCSL